MGPEEHRLAGTNCAAVAAAATAVVAVAVVAAAVGGCVDAAWHTCFGWLLFDSENFKVKATFLQFLRLFTSKLSVLVKKIL